MVMEAYVHEVPTEVESHAEWCLSVSYGGTLSQIRLHGSLVADGSLQARLSLELRRLAEALSSISAEPSVVLWDRPRSNRSESPGTNERKAPQRAGSEAAQQSNEPARG